MKQIILSFSIGVLLIACGQNQKEIEANNREKQDSIHIADSIKAEDEITVQQRVQDSLADIKEIKDSIARVQFVADSIENFKRGTKKM